MNAEQVVDILVAKAKLVLPRVGLRKLGPGQYEVFGQHAKLELVTKLQGSDAEAAIAQAAGNPLVELVVVIGGRRNLLADFVAGWTENSTQVPVGGSAIQALPDRDRVSFEEVFPSTRAEAMQVALMEAEAREHLAKEKLAARAAVSAVQQSTNSSFSIGSQASLTPNTGSWSLDASRLDASLAASHESSMHSARSPSHWQSAQQQVLLPGPRALSPIPQSPSLELRSLSTRSERPQSPQPGSRALSRIPQSPSMDLRMVSTKPERSQSPQPGNRALSPMPQSTSLDLRMVSTKPERPQSPQPGQRSLSPMPGNRQGRGGSLTLPFTSASLSLPLPGKGLTRQLGGSLNLPLPGSKSLSLPVAGGGSLTLPIPGSGSINLPIPGSLEGQPPVQHVRERPGASEPRASQRHVRERPRADSRQRTYSPAPSPTRRAQSPDGRLRSMTPDRTQRSVSPSPSMQASEPPSPRVVLQWQPARNAYAPQKKKHHDWLLEEKPGTRSVSPDARGRGQSPMRMGSLGAIPQSSPSLSPYRAVTPQRQERQASSPHSLLNHQQRPHRFISLPAGTMMRRESGVNMGANASAVLSVQTLQDMTSAESVSSVLPEALHGQGAFHSPNPPPRPVRKSVPSATQRWEAGASKASLTISTLTLPSSPMLVPDAPLNSARSHQAASPARSPTQASRSRDFRSPSPMARNVDLGYSRSSSSTAPVKPQYTLRVPSNLDASFSSIQSIPLQEVAGRQISLPPGLSAKVLAAPTQLKHRQQTPERLQGQLQEPMAPPPTSAKLIPLAHSGVDTSGTGSQRASTRTAHRNGAASSSSAKAAATLLWDVECFSDSQLSYELTKKARAIHLNPPAREPPETRNAYAFGARGDSQYAGVSPELLNAKLLNLRADMITRNRSQTFSPGMSRHTSSSSSSASGTTASAETQPLNPPAPGEPIQAPAGDQAEMNAATENDQSFELPLSFWQPALEFSGELAGLRKQLATGVPSANYPQTDAASDTGSQKELPWTLWQANTELRGELAQLRQKLASTTHRSETLQQRLVEAKSRSQEAMSAIQMLHAVRQAGHTVSSEAEGESRPLTRESG